MHFLLRKFVSSGQQAELLMWEMWPSAAEILPAANADGQSDTQNGSYTEAFPTLSHFHPSSEHPALV